MRTDRFDVLAEASVEKCDIVAGGDADGELALVIGSIIEAVVEGDFVGLTSTSIELLRQDETGTIDGSGRLVKVCDKSVGPAIVAATRLSETEGNGANNVREFPAFRNDCSPRVIDLETTVTNDGSTVAITFVKLVIILAFKLIVDWMETFRTVSLEWF